MIENSNDENNQRNKVKDKCPQLYNYEIRICGNLQRSYSRLPIMRRLRDKMGLKNPNFTLPKKISQ